MPRPPKHPHALRSALKLLGMTQKELAERLGIASVTIEKFINGNSEISTSLGFRISEETGLDFEQLMFNSDPEKPRILDAAQNAAKQRAMAYDEAIRFTKRLIAASLQASRENDQFNYQSMLRFTADKLIKEFRLAARTKTLLGIPLERSLMFPGREAFKLPRAKSAKRPKRRSL